MPIAIDALSKIQNLSFGQSQYSKRIAVVPIIGNLEGPTYNSLSSALEMDQLEISEVESGETVPELEATNLSPLNILILEGEELIGAMQNRILNTSVLLPPMARTKIPVSCTEAGRWERVSPSFADADEMAPFSIRSGIKNRVSDSMNFNGTRSAGQGEVWDDINQVESDLETNSPTSALNDTTSKYREISDETVRSFQLLPDQVGATVFIDGRLAGVDIVSSPVVFQAFWAKLMRSYVLDTNRMDPEPTRNDVNHAVQARRMVSEILRAEWIEFDAVGNGKDLRLQYDGAAGSALVYEDSLVHLSVLSNRIGALSEKK